MLPPRLLPHVFVSSWNYRPSRPENQFANCWPLMLGVKLSTLSAPSLLRAGVCGAVGTVWPRGLRVGVDLRPDDSLSLVRKVRDADLGVRRLRLECPDVESMLIGVAVSVLLPPNSDAVVFSLDSTTLIVGVDELCESCFARPGECASICIGSGTPDLTQGRTV